MDISTYGGRWNFSIGRSPLPTIYLSLLTAVFVLIGVAGCSLSSPEFDPEIKPGVFQFNFETGWQGWEPIVVGIPFNKENGEDLADVETKSEHRSLPAEVEEDGNAIFFFGDTSWVGMSLFLKRRIEGLRPGTTYRVQFEVEIASQTPENCLGAGSSSGRVVVAAESMEPVRDVRERRTVNEYVFNEPIARSLNFEETIGSLEPPIMGTIDNGIPCAEAHEMGLPWRLKRLESGPDFWRVTADKSGSVWLLAGLWTAHLGPTRFYFNEITARFEAVNS